MPIYDKQCMYVQLYHIVFINNNKSIYYDVTTTRAFFWVSQLCDHLGTADLPGLLLFRVMNFLICSLQTWCILKKKKKLVNFCEFKLCRFCYMHNYSYMYESWCSNWTSYFSFYSLLMIIKRLFHEASLAELN